jgi:glycosyltransferase involved in cell wall biosynthesis
MTNDKLNILIINFDWDNLFEGSFNVVHDKMTRDQLGPDINNFFFYSWGNVSYFKKRDQFSSFHQRIYGKFFKPIFDILSIWTVPRAIKKQGFKPDVVLFYDLGHVLAARAIKKRYGSTTVYCSTNMPKDYSATRKWGFIKSIYSSLLEKFFLDKFDFAYTINDTMRNFLIGLGVSPEKVVVFTSNTIFRDKKYIEASERGKIKRKFRMDKDAKMILSVGRLEAEKDHPRMIHLFSQLSSDYRLVVLGSGSLLMELQRLAKELNIADRVFLKDGSIEKKYGTTIEMRTSLSCCLRLRRWA